MDNREKLRKLFARELGIDEAVVVDNLTYNTIQEWDSVAHMRLVAAIDDGFDIMLDAEDVIDMSSFAKAIDILKKYNVEF
ncbi:MAG: acyl carrier protein [Candidatus Magnetoovum sp. WYHC-5]|nr:acyl carrier protein [Candidatus Magnetoovum sp. WYHC-5]